MSLIVDGTTGVTFNDSSLQGAAASPYVLKNRIINGDMRIDQRNAGASVTLTVSNTYCLDRWGSYLSAASKYSVQQNAASVTPPAGFSNYLGITSLSSYSIGASDFFFTAQPIEGFNTADLAFGTANAKTVTLSFWVRSSLTGTFGGSLRNSAGDRSYPFTYTISSANTWEQKSITIAGDTSGTWLTTNGVGFYVSFGFGIGSTFSGTAGAWAAANYISATGSTSIVGTNGATWYLTGVQLEVGTSATPFERRLYGTELALCQRYYQTYGNYEGVGVAKDTTAAFFYYTLNPQMRTSATCTFTCPAVDRIGIALTSTTGTGIVFATDNMVVHYATVTMSGMGQPCSPASGALLTASAEL